MKIVVGIDPLQSPENLINLLRRLAFPAPEVVFASFAPYPVVATPGFSASSGELTQRILTDQKDAAQKAMARAVAEVEPEFKVTETAFDFGDASGLLEKTAENCNSDLIAIGSRLCGPLEAAVMGSVGRGLTLHAKRSVLIAKGEIRPSGNVKAVFAYDASDSCEKSIDRLIEMRPHGLSHIDVVIADTPSESHSPVTDLRGEGAWSLGPERRHDLLMEYAGPAAERLAAAGYEVRAICTPGPVAQVIRGAVVELHADLVIMGAQGHGFVERVLFGSMALEQAVSEPHSVLIIRP